MNLPYVTVAVTGTNIAAQITDAPLPELPFDYFALPPHLTNWIVLFPESVQDVPNVGDFVGAFFSAYFPDSAAVLAEVDDQDVFRLRVFANGEPVAEYRAQPGYADGEDLPPAGGDAGLIGKTVGIHDEQTIADLSEVLSANQYDDVFGFGFAKERHAEIAELLGVPAAAVGLGYDSLSRGIVPDDTAPGSLLLISRAHQSAASSVQLRQYVLFTPAPFESDAQIAARFLPDVISWDDDFLIEELPMLGTVAQVRDAVLARLPVAQQQPQADWIRITDADQDRIEIDLAGTKTKAEEMLREVRLYSLTGDGVIPYAFFRQLCQGTTWRIWDYRTRQIIS